MAKRYTAQEMRDMADYREAWGDKDGANDMLRQAADLQEREEREKKYEYTIRFIDGDRIEVADIHRDTEEGAKNLRLGIYKEVVVRREVGEWNEVNHGE